MERMGTWRIARLTDVADGGCAPAPRMVHRCPSPSIAGRSSLHPDGPPRSLQEGRASRFKVMAPAANEFQPAIPGDKHRRTRLRLGVLARVGLLLYQFPIDRPASHHRLQDRDRLPSFGSGINNQSASVSLGFQRRFINALPVRFISLDDPWRQILPKGDT